MPGEADTERPFVPQKCHRCKQVIGRHPYHMVSGGPHSIHQYPEHDECFRYNNGDNDAE